MSAALKKMVVLVEGPTRGGRASIRSQRTIYTLAAGQAALVEILTELTDARGLDRRRAEVAIRAEWENGCKIVLPRVMVSILTPEVGSLLEALHQRLGDEAERPIAAAGAMARLIVKTCALTEKSDERAGRLTDAIAIDYVRRAVNEQFPEGASEIMARVEAWAASAGTIDEQLKKAVPR